MAEIAEIAIAGALALVEVLSHIDQRVNHHTNVHEEVRDIGNWLKTVQAHLRDMNRKEGSEVLKDRENQLRDLVYDIEDVLDGYMLHVPQRLHRHKISRIASKVAHYPERRLALYEVSSQIEIIKRKVNNLIALDPLIRNGLITSEEGSSSGTRVQDYASYQILEEEEIMGFEEHKKKLINQLLVGKSRSISVVGLGGSGKTILVKNVYENKRVLGQFDCHAWIQVSRSFQIDEVLRSMYGQICDGREEHNLGDTPTKLRNHLRQKRYVIVLDDIWSKQDLESIVNALPNGIEGSRIIVTTQNSDVALSCVDLPLYVHQLNCLSWEHSWGLFCKKAFRANNGECPQELEEWSQKIVKKCEGLPFAIVAVGSLLSKKEQDRDEWRKLHDSLGSKIGTDSELQSISRVLLPSYMDLSSNLKSCFLYFSIFPEDYSIQRRRLIRLWVAEGFVKKKSGIDKTLEEVAEDYLNELIGRNLVHASGRDFDGRVTSCRVLNLVREFIILKSNEEKFVTILSEVTEPDGTGVTEKIRRLSIHEAGTNLSRVRALSCVRTLFMFAWDQNSFCSMIGKVLYDFRLLRVLDLQGAPLENFPKAILKLTLLRYLSLRETNIKTVPASIKKLGFLQTLDLRQTFVAKLPSEICTLQVLRHLLVYRYDVKNYVTYDSVQGVEVSAGFGALSAIQKLSLVKVNKRRGIIKDLENLICLRKLGLIGLRKEDGRELCASIQKMPYLSTLDVGSTSKEDYLDLDGMGCISLQRLYLKGRLEKFPEWISSLDSLVRIGLKWSRLKENDNPLETLQALPKLMELEMVDSYTGKELHFRARTFKKLKILHIEEFDQLNKVVVGKGAMPNLEKLTLCKCENLKMPPFGISQDHTHLEELMLYDMHKDFISNLQKDSKHRWMVGGIRLIHSFTLDSSRQSWSFQNLS